MKKSLSIAAALAAVITLSGCVSDEYVVGGAALGGVTGAAVGGAVTGNPGGVIAGAAIGGAGGALAGAAISPHKGSPYHEPTADEYDHLTTGPARCLREGYAVDGSLVCLRWSDPYYTYTQHQTHIWN